MTSNFIPNRRGLNLSVAVELACPQKGLVFVMHGLGGFKDQTHIKVMSEVFAENGYSVIRFDTTNTFGESDGSYEDATMTNYYEDLEDVIHWASTQTWYQEPFMLAGHSLGGMGVALYAERFPEKVKAVAPISTVVSGALSVEAHKRYEPEEFKKWETSGWRIKESQSRPGSLKRLKWSHIQDRLKYDLMPLANRLTMPVLLVVGEKDTATLPEHQRLLYEALPGKKELHVIDGSGHSFRDSNHLVELKLILTKWLNHLQ